MLMHAERPEWLPTLGSGEQLLWLGQPSRQPIVFRPRDLPHLLTGIVLVLVALNMSTLFGFSGSAGVDPLPRPAMFDVVNGAFLLMGLFELVGRHVINLVRRIRTSYALTTHRVFIHTGLFHQVTRERWLSPTDPPEFKIRADGAGTIVFAPPEPRRGSRRRGRDLVEAVSAGLDGFQFYGLPDADRVRAFLVND